MHWPKTRRKNQEEHMSFIPSDQRIAEVMNRVAEMTNRVVRRVLTFVAISGLVLVGIVILLVAGLVVYANWDLDRLNNLAVPLWLIYFELMIVIYYLARLTKAKGT